MMEAVRVVIADDHRLVCEGLRALLGPPFEVVETVQRGDAVMSAVRSVHPSVLLLDLTMPGLNGFGVARQVRSEAPLVKIMMLTMHSDIRFVDEAWRIGIHGFALKTIGMGDLRRGIHEILAGRRYLCSELTVEKRKGYQPLGMRRLSGRQTEVLRLIAQGLSGTRIAEELGVSPKTVDYHRAEIRRALGLYTTAELVRYAVSAGMVPSDVRIPD